MILAVVLVIYDYTTIINIYCYVCYMLYYAYTCALYTLSHSTIYIMHTSDDLAVALKKYSKKRAPDTAALGMHIYSICIVYDIHLYYTCTMCIYMTS